MARKKTVKKKVEIVFDSEKRKEFLTGFRKRKNERRKRAKEELERNVKEERKRIRLEIKDGIKHMKKSFEPLRELTEQDKANEEYEDDDVKVQIVELTTNELTAQKSLLGENRAVESEDSAEEEESDDSKAPNTNCIPGMDFDVNRKRKKQLNHTEGDAESTNEPTSIHKESKSFRHEEGAPEIKNKKDLDRLKKNKTMKKLKQSKVFKLKERFDKTANQKKAKRDRNNTLKSLPKNQRKKKLEPSRYHKGRMLNRKQFRKKKQS